MKLSRVQLLGSLQGKVSSLSSHSDLDVHSYIQLIQLMSRKVEGSRAYAKREQAEQSYF